MGLILAPQYTRRTYSWTDWKVAQGIRDLQTQYDDDGSTYTIFGYDGPEVHVTTIWKGDVPGGVVSGYSQAQNDTDKADFETNFKPYANRTVDDIPSILIANSIKAVISGTANLGVNGSVTPVVFEYSAPNTHDIQIDALSFLFEDTTVLAFGNRFVTNAVTTLANGMLLECKASNQSFTWQNMRRTRDIIEISSDFSIVTGTSNFMRVKIQLPGYLRLARVGTFGTADYLRITVRDDLSSLDFAECFFQGVKL